MNKKCCRFPPSPLKSLITTSRRAGRHIHHYLLHALGFSDWRDRSPTSSPLEPCFMMFSKLITTWPCRVGESKGQTCSHEHLSACISPRYASFSFNWGGMQTLSPHLAQYIHLPWLCHTGLLIAPLILTCLPPSNPSFTWGKRSQDLTYSTLWLGLIIRPTY